MSWTWKILLVCIILGGAQWMHVHPDSKISEQSSGYLHAVQVEWDDFTAHAGEYLDKFPGYMRQLLDTVPKPIIDTPPSPKKP